MAEPAEGGAAKPLSNESPSAEIRNTLLTPGLGGQLDNDAVEAKMRRRLAGASSWRGFFIEVATKLAFLAVLLLVVWAVSLSR